jgi:predicted AAA+ superfamily ATPase
MRFTRAIVEEVEKALRDGPRLLQVIVGPRQVGKTTAAEEVAARLGWPGVFESADFAPPPGPEWIETHWARARALSGESVLLVLDEIQKVRGWSETVKRLWDEERRLRSRGLRVLLLGSSALQLHQGTSESLAGRFFLHRCMHWSFPECARAFGWSLEQWLYFGGYPGAAAFSSDERQWVRYVSDALVETAISKDVLQLHTVNKPALLRSLFGLAASHPAQILSFNKMLGQLVDAGNTTTLAHYLDLLGTAFLVSGLQLFSPGNPRRRGSSPKLIFWNSALINAFHGASRQEAMRDGAWWGRIVENAVGAHLLNSLCGEPFTIHYWRDGRDEVDFVVSGGGKTLGFEVKSGRQGKCAGLAAFRKKFPQADIRIIGSGGIPLEEFFSRSACEWL